MELSRENEAKLMKQYEKMIWKTVHTFNHHVWHSLSEDMFQEASIVFLQHIRKAEDMAELRRFPTMDIWNRLCRVVIAYQPVSFPERTSDFTQKAASTTALPFDKLVDMAESKTEDDLVAKITIEDFLATLPERDREILKMRANGEVNNDIASRFGLTPGGVTHLVQRTAKKYYEYAA